MKSYIDALVDAVGNLGTADLVEAIVQAFARDWLDIPFPVNPEARGAVIPDRARDNSIRYREVGNLPFNNAIRKAPSFEGREKALSAKRSPGFSLVCNVLPNDG